MLYVTRMPALIAIFIGRAFKPFSKEALRVGPVKVIP
jgi:hypothetical protein